MNARRSLFDRELDVSELRDNQFAGKRRLNVNLEFAPTAVDPKLRLKVFDGLQPTFLMLFECADPDYAELREAQSLKVDFGRFPQKLAELLKRCCPDTEAAIRFELWLEQYEDGRFLLVVLEPNEFRTLKHISLLLRPGADDELALHARALAERYAARVKQSQLSAELAQSERHETERRFEALKKDMESSMLESDRARHRHDEEVRRLRQQVLELKQEKTTTEQACETATAEATTLRAELEKLRIELDQAREEKERARSQIQELNRSLDAARQQIEVLERVSKEGDKVASQLNTMLSANNNERNRLESLHVELATKQAALEEKLKATEADRTTLQDRNRSLEEAVSEQANIAERMAGYRSKCEQLEGQVEDLRVQAKESTELREELDTARKLASEQTRIIENNWEVIRWLNQELTNSALRSGKESATATKLS